MGHWVCRTLKSRLVLAPPHPLLCAKHALTPMLVTYTPQCPGLKPAWVGAQDWGEVTRAAAEQRS